MEGEGTESVQPEGQGAEGSDSSGFYQDYLSNNVPEDYRPHVEPYLRDIENNANSRFREHAEYRQQWEPYEELGINEYEPESLGQLLEFAELLNDDDSFRDWWVRAGQEKGFIDALTEQLNANEDSDDYDEDYDDEENQPDVQEIIQQELAKHLQPLMEREREREQSELLAQADSTIDQQLEELEREHNNGEAFPEEVEQAIYRFAWVYADDDPDAIKKGYQDYLNMVSSVERDTVTRKVNGPKPPETGRGPANTNPEPVTSFSEAKRIAKERFARAS